MHKAFILEPVNYDVSGAEEFGHVVYVFDKNCSRVSIWSEEFKSSLIDALSMKGYDVTRDFIVITGHTVLLMLAVSAVLETYKQARLLLYSGTERRYIQKEIHV